MTATQRGALLRKLGDLVAANAKELAALEVRDNGKLFAEMNGQLNYIPQWYYYYGGLADKIEGSVIPTDKADMFNYTRYEPVGVVGMIIPGTRRCCSRPGSWLRLSLPATPSSSSRPSSRPRQRWRSSGWLNRPGSPRASSTSSPALAPTSAGPLVEHPLVAKIAFTGSDATGQKVYEAAARGLKRVTMELGGKSPNIVFDDAEIENAVKGVISGIFAQPDRRASQGRGCSCSRAFTISSSTSWWRLRRRRGWAIR
jgi:aldehyde dehydrogenase (NAD+)